MLETDNKRERERERELDCMENTFFSDSPLVSVTDFSSVTEEEALNMR